MEILKPMYINIYFINTCSYSLFFNKYFLFFYAKRKAGRTIYPQFSNKILVIHIYYKIIPLI